MPSLSRAAVWRGVTKVWRRFLGARFGGTERAGEARAEAWCAGGEGGKEPGDVADEVGRGGRRVALGRRGVLSRVRGSNKVVKAVRGARYSFGRPEKRKVLSV